MVRISDILKKLKQDQGASQGEGAKAPHSQQPLKTGKESPGSEERRKREDGSGESVKDHITFIEAMKQNEPGKPAEAHIHEIVKKAIPEKGEGQNIYNEIVECCRKMAAGYAEAQEVKKDIIVNIAGKIADHILLGGQELLVLASGPYFEEEDYRILDLVNTGIIAGYVSSSLNYNKSKLMEVILTGLFHEVGVFKDLDFLKESRKLTVEEFHQMREHPERSALYIQNLAAFSEEVVAGVLHHHERINGGGYPKGLSENDINEYAQIVAIADVYEALIHKRPHKNKILSPVDAIKELIAFKDSLFNHRILKALIETVGIYPIGSWVEISSGEICRVLATNEEFPLRPVLSVAFGSNRKRLDEMQTIDLKLKPSLYIKRPVEESELKEQ